MPVSRRNVGLGAGAFQHCARAENLLQRIHTKSPTTCPAAVKALSRAAVARSHAEECEEPTVILAAENVLKSLKRAVRRSCKERDCRTFELEGLRDVEPLLTRGFKDGRKSWIDVFPSGGPRMRVTHEVLEGLSRAVPPPIPAHARRKCLAWRFEGRNRVCAIYDNESEPSVFAFGRPSGTEGLAEPSRRLPRIKRGVRHARVEADIAKTVAEMEREEIEHEARLAAMSAKQRLAIEKAEEEEMAESIERMEKMFAQKLAKHAQKQATKARRRGGMSGLEGVGSSLAMMWAAAGAVALIALSDAQRDKLFSPKPNAEAEATLISLNAARARQGLPPLTR